MINQLRDRKFDYIGGLYFRWAVDHGPQKLDNTAELDTLLIILAVTKSPTADIESPNDVNQDESKPSASGDSAGGEDAKVVLLQSTASVTLFGRSEEVKQKNSGIESEFCVNRILDSLFFMANRLYLPGIRGAVPKLSRVAKRRDSGSARMVQEWPHRGGRRLWR